MRSCRGRYVWVGLVAVIGWGASGCGGRRVLPREDYGRLPLAELEHRASGSDARALREIAFRAASEGQLARAQEHLDRALAVEPNSPDAYNIRGMLRAAAGKPEDAARDFRRAAELGPTRVGPRRNLARLYTEQSQHLAAAAAWQEVARLNPRDLDAALQAGDAWLRGGSEVAAKKYYRLALSIDPRSARANAGLGEAFLNSGHSAEARDYLTRAGELGDRSARTRGYLGLAMALGAGGKQQAREALAELRAAIAAGERGPHLDYGMALAHFAAADYPAAERAAREGLRKYPEVPGLYYVLADVYAVTRRPQESARARARSAEIMVSRQQEENLRNAIADAPGQSQPYLAYAAWLLKRREYARAVPVLRQALDLEPGNRDALVELRQAEAGLRRGKASKAAQPATASSRS